MNLLTIITLFIFPQYLPISSLIITSLIFTPGADRQNYSVFIFILNIHLKSDLLTKLGQWYSKSMILTSFNILICTRGKYHIPTCLNRSVLCQYLRWIWKSFISFSRPVWTRGEYYWPNCYTRSVSWWIFQVKMNYEVFRWIFQVNFHECKQNITKSLYHYYFNLTCHIIKQLLTFMEVDTGL